MFSLAGFARVEVFTSPETVRVLGPAFSKWFLMKDSIRIRANMTYIECNLPLSKSDPFLEGSKTHN